MLGVEPKLRQPLEHHRQDLLRFRPSQVRAKTEKGRRIAVRGPQARQATDILLTLGRMTPSAMASR